MGRDIASYDNTSDNYTVTRNADGSVTVADISGGASSGRDTLRNIEIVKFIDTGLRLHGGIHDFDDSGSADILLRNSEGVTGLWSMNGITVTSLTLTSVQVLNDWEIKAIADFDGNGTSDILWLHADSGSALDGVSYVSYQDGAAATGGNVVQQLSGWSIAGVGDFTGDGKADVLYRSDTTGMTYLDVMDGAAIDWGSSGFTSSQVTDTKWTVAAVADFNGDGKADLLWRYDNAADLSDPLNGTLFEWKMDGSNVTSADLLSQQASGNWQVAGTGDFDGNGTADILFRYHNASNTSDALNGLSYIDFMNGEMVAKGAPTRWQVGEDWQLASIGDFDGNLKSDILWRQTSTGATYAWLMDGTNVAAAGFTSEQAGTGWATQNGTLIG